MHPPQISSNKKIRICNKQAKQGEYNADTYVDPEEEGIAKIGIVNSRINGPKNHYVDPTQIQSMKNIACQRALHPENMHHCTQEEAYHCTALEKQNRDFGMQKLGVGKIGLKLEI